MDLISSLQEARKKLLEKNSDPEYQDLCLHYQAESQRLIALAQGFLSENKELLTDMEQQAIRREYASGSDLHRGFYCPCPVFELIVGNSHRGKLLKRLTSRSRPTHEYGFDADGRLLWAKRFHEGNPVFTEFLQYREDRRYGFTLDASQELRTVTEEVFREGHLTRYTNCLTVQIGDTLRCVELNSYGYTYVDQSLIRYDWDHFVIPRSMETVSVPGIPEVFDSCSALPPMLRHSRYHFNCENGIIVSYSINGETYIPRGPRKD